MRKYLAVDYEFCTGCHTCEIACQQEHGLAPCLLYTSRCV